MPYQVATMLAPRAMAAFSFLLVPNSLFLQAMNRATPWLSQALLGIEVERPVRFTGSGDGLFQYCTAFAYLVLAAAATAVWSLVSEVWGRRVGRAANYGRLHQLLRLTLRFHLIYQMIQYGAMKIWCNQFPPISDSQLERRLGDSSPMGVLWQFMQCSQVYTSATGLVEFACGLLLIGRRTTLLGALLSAGAMFQVFLLNMCYDVPVKLMSGHLVLMALTLIAPDAGRLGRFFLLGRPVEPRVAVPLFGGWKWLNRAGLVLRTALFCGYAALTLNQYYQEATHRGILAPENPTIGRWVVVELSKDGKPVPVPEQPDNPPPRQVTPSKWQGGPGLPTVTRLSIASGFATLMFEDGSGVSYMNTSANHSELSLVSRQEGRRMATLAVSFPEPGRMTLRGPFDGQEVRMTLRAVRAVKKDYVFRSRSFRWVQEAPFNP